MGSRVGQQLGKYRLVRLLGQGSFAEVYLGEHVHLKTAAAVKVLTTLLTDEDAESFLNEAQIIARLVHPHIIRIFDFDVQEVGTPFLVMEYAPNGTLRQPNGVQLPPKTIVAYAQQVADALQYAHDQKLIHRDVKPENMLLGRRQEILLSDFGIAQVAQTTLMENTQKIAGTMTYMSPEQLHGKARFASDQYALGVVVYEWLTGDRPFHGSFSELVTQHLFVPPPPLREKNQTIPPAVEEVVMTALAKDFKQRFASVQAFANALEQAFSSQPPASISTAPTSLLFTSPPTSTGIQPSHVQEQPSVPPAPSIPTATRNVADQFIEEQQQSSLATTPSLPPAPGAAIFTDPPVASITARPDGVASRSSPFQGKVILLVVLALFIAASGLGLFYVNSARQMDITKAHATSTAVAQAIASATASVLAANPNPYPPGGGMLALYDSLRDDSSGSGWDKGSTNCDFIGGAYHVVAIGIRHLEFCVAQSTDFSDFAYEVQMAIVKGDVGGMIFRANSANGAYYLFFVSKDGYYSLYFCSGKTCRQPFASKFHPSIKQGLNQINRIAVEALGPTITLYINHQRVASVNDSTYSHGQIGLVASPYANTDDTTEVVYSNARVWTLKIH